MRRLHGSADDRALAAQHVAISANAVTVKVTIAGELYATMATREALDEVLTAADLDPYGVVVALDAEWAVILHWAVGVMVTGVSAERVAVGGSHRSRPANPHSPARSTG